jgi:fructose-1,6-bisphosphatase/sedoheptulose 1,7-bisphosphatase-like protein
MSDTRKTIRLSLDLTKKIEALAAKENRNFSNMVVTILDKAVAYPDLILSLKAEQHVPQGN